jgi:plastocyanin
LKPARLSAVLLISVSLLAASCGSPPEDTSSESSRAQQREEAAATAPTTEMTREETTPTPEKTTESAAKERAVGEGEARRDPKPKKAPEGEVVEVKIRGLEYLPGPVTVSPGTTVRWVNEDQALHTVTSEGPGGPLESEELARGDSYEYTFREAGQYDYYCVVHPFMKAGVTVG